MLALHRRRAVLLVGAALALAAVPALADDAYQPTPENLRARAAFRDARFGLFIHWGVYSVLGDGEWVMNQRKIKVADYEKLPAFFDPVEFDPAAWVAMAKGAGHEVHYDHLQAPRRIRHVRLEGVGLEHRGPQPLQEGSR